MLPPVTATPGVTIPPSITSLAASDRDFYNAATCVLPARVHDILAVINGGLLLTVGADYSVVDNQTDPQTVQLAPVATGIYAVQIVSVPAAGAGGAVRTHFAPAPTPSLVPTIVPPVLLTTQGLTMNEVTWRGDVTTNGSAITGTVSGKANANVGGTQAAVNTGSGLRFVAQFFLGFPLYEEYGIASNIDNPYVKVNKDSKYVALYLGGTFVGGSFFAYASCMGFYAYADRTVYTLNGLPYYTGPALTGNQYQPVARVTTGTGPLAGARLGGQQLVGV